MQAPLPPAGAPAGPPLGVPLSPPPAKRACCISVGCSENRLEGSLIASYLQRNDWQMVEDPAAAELVIVNSCGFTAGNASQSLALYKQLAARCRPGARVLLAGCLPAVDRQAVLAAGYDDVLITPRTLALLDDVIGARMPIAAGPLCDVIPCAADGLGLGFMFQHERAQRAVKTLARILIGARCLPVPRWLWQFLYLPDSEVEFVRISMGCSSHCSFCCIPQAKGATRSVPPVVVLDQVRDALRRGKRHVALSCDELASYGQDLGIDIVQLLDRITALSGDYRVILRNVHPEWALRYWDGLLPILRRGRVSYMILPVQSGSDHVLGLMRRNHTAAQYRRLVDDIRTVAPAVILRTHFLVGFPGETAQDFQETCTFAAQLPVDSFCVHEYSTRQRTVAVRLPDPVPPQVAHARARALRRIGWANYGRAFRWLPLRPASPCRPGGDEEEVGLRP